MVFPMTAAAMSNDAEVRARWSAVLDAQTNADFLTSYTIGADELRALVRIAAEARSHDGEWEVEYEVWQKDAFGPDCDGMVAGSCSLAEAQHYVAVYGQDSPAWLVEVRRRSLSAVPLFDEGRL